MRYSREIEHHRTEPKPADFCMLYVVLIVEFYLQYYFFSIPKELKEEITRILKANNPHAPQNIVRYSFKVSVA